MQEVSYSSKNRPQRLCKKCGKCCTMALCQYSLDELREFAHCPESESKDFLEVFVPYDNLDIPMQISKEYVELALSLLKEQGKYREGAPVFYRCKYINDDNTCSKYENRYGWCHRAPTHAWTLMPIGCGFAGWQFALREQIKHNVRKLKEYLYECELLYGEGIIPDKNITVPKLRQVIMTKILAFERFGSLNW